MNIISEQVNLEMRRELFRANALELREHCKTMWDILVLLDAKVGDQEETIKQQDHEIKWLRRRLEDSQLTNP